VRRQRDSADSHRHAHADTHSELRVSTNGTSLNLLDNPVLNGFLLPPCEPLDPDCGECRYFRHVASFRGLSSGPVVTRRRNRVFYFFPLSRGKAAAGSLEKRHVRLVGAV